MEITLPDHSRTRGQIGVETLIIFIAMILVAAIAATILINTAGFLQNQASQTSQDSEDQVSNQVLVISSVGEVAAPDEIEFSLHRPNDRLDVVTFDAEGTVTVTVEDEGGTSEDVDISGPDTDITTNGFDFSQEITITHVDANDEEITLVLDADAGETDTDTLALDARGNTISEVSVLVMQSPGANEIDLAGASIEYVGPDGQELLSYSENPEVGEFGVEGTQDPGDTVPVLTKREDRYTVTMDLETDAQSSLRYLEEGEDATVRITTQAGSEAVTILNVPQSISSYDQGDAVEL
ncbi:archaellin/type IV pilin N-terminal domain-containing protein [Natranaeroarchaeum aerophilus]|uniref:Flagellin n=1 Tax=Natranaeroarchaeum aerophilus TaxID=2917711 RepID=A0AAE3FSY8_9EURY|nr:archaellin/type IV pilin N-terminal domain-containing protein [Natranaeroarchaeum aerophilus]MCL9814636.1 hypothetical protein [Natranaeroarchaeum aerophilus]